MIDAPVITAHALRDSLCAWRNELYRALADSDGILEAQHISDEQMSVLDIANTDL